MKRPAIIQRAQRRGRANAALKNPVQAWRSRGNNRRQNAKALVRDPKSRKMAKDYVSGARKQLVNDGRAAVGAAKSNVTQGARNAGQYIVDNKGKATLIGGGVLATGAATGGGVAYHKHRKNNMSANGGYTYFDKQRYDSRVKGAAIGGAIGSYPGALVGAGAGSVLGSNKKKKLSNKDRNLLIGTAAAVPGIGAIGPAVAAAHGAGKKHKYEAGAYLDTTDFMDDKKRYPISNALTHPGVGGTIGGAYGAAGGAVGGAAIGKKYGGRKGAILGGITGALTGGAAGGAASYGSAKLQNKIHRRGDLHRKRQAAARGKKYANAEYGFDYYNDTIDFMRAPKVFGNMGGNFKPPKFKRPSMDGFKHAGQRIGDGTKNVANRGKEMGVNAHNKVKSRIAHRRDGAPRGERARGQVRFYKDEVKRHTGNARKYIGDNKKKVAAVGIGGAAIAGGGAYGVHEYRKRNQFDAGYETTDFMFRRKKVPLTRRQKAKKYAQDKAKQARDYAGNQGQRAKTFVGNNKKGIGYGVGALTVAGGGAVGVNEYRKRKQFAAEMEFLNEFEEDMDFAIDILNDDIEFDAEPELTALELFQLSRPRNNAGQFEAGNTAAPSADSMHSAYKTTVPPLRDPTGGKSLDPSRTPLG